MIKPEKVKEIRIVHLMKIFAKINSKAFKNIMKISYEDAVKKEKEKYPNYDFLEFIQLYYTTDKARCEFINHFNEYYKQLYNENVDIILLKSILNFREDKPIVIKEDSDENETVGMFGLFEDGSDSE